MTDAQSEKEMRRMEMRNVQSGNREENIESRVALISIIVEDTEAANRINDLLHEYRRYIIGRMGIPYPAKQISVISVALDAPQDAVSALSGKLGAIRGVSTKTIYSKL